MPYRYPLTWPHGRVRTEPVMRRRADFGTRRPRDGMRYARHRPLTMAEANRRLRDEFRKMELDLDDVVVSTDLQLRVSDGLPRSGQRSPDDPGVAVYFERKGRSHVIPCDSYDRLEDNIAAVAATLDALRRIERHGSQMADQAYTAWEALAPPGDDDGGAWFQVLGCAPTANYEEVKACYYEQRSKHHPDHGGDPARFQAVLEAWREFQTGRRTA